MDTEKNELKQWEKPQLKVISTIETNETVLKTESGGPPPDPNQPQG